MTYNDMLNLVLALPFDTMKEVYSNGEQSLLIFRPSTLSKRFKNYDVNTNFQIFLKIGDDKPFKPNHLRLLIDLKLRAREIPQSRIELLTAFDKIFYGAEPLEAISPLTHINFTQYINPIDINPPSLYIHGWIRTFIASDHEIDQIVYRICRNTPPAVKYTCQDDKNHPKYNPNAELLWYID